MKDYKGEFSEVLASTGALFFKVNPNADNERERWQLTLKDGRPTPYFVNIGGFDTGSKAYQLGGFFAEAALENKIINDGDILLGPAHKGISLACSTALYLCLDKDIDNVRVVYDHKEEERFINQRLNNGLDLLSSAFELVSSGGNKLKRSSIVAAPSYESSPLAVATAIISKKMMQGDLAFAYDRHESKTIGEGSGKAVNWVGRAPGEGDDVFVVYNSSFVDDERLSEFKKSIEDNGAKVKGVKYLDYNGPTQFTEQSRIHLIDDVGTSMKTKEDIISLLNDESERLGYPVELASVLIGIDREQVGAVYDENKPKDLPNIERVILSARGEDAIGDFTKKTGVPVNLVAGISEVMDILHKRQIPVNVNDEMRPLDNAVMREFEKYMEIYGARR